MLGKAVIRPNICDYEKNQDEWLSQLGTGASIKPFEEELPKDFPKLIPNPPGTPEASPRRRPLALH